MGYKILIAVPTYENITPDTYKSIWDLDKGDHEVLFEFVRGYDCARARNEIAVKALELDTDYVLMVDNDVTLPKDALLNMIEDTPLVCLGYYAHRDPGKQFAGKTNICKLDGTPRYTNQYTEEDMEEMRKESNWKVKVHGGGLGCALIMTDIFRKMTFPWFDWANYANGRVLSEDLYFCERCNIAGIPILMDVRVNCGHLIRYIQEV